MTIDLFFFHKEKIDYIAVFFLSNIFVFMSIIDQYHRNALMILVTNAYKHIFDRGKKEEIVDGRKDNAITDIILYKRLFKINKFYILTAANPLMVKFYL
jgi:hypothetical protein